MSDNQNQDRLVEATERRQSVRKSSDDRGVKQDQVDGQIFIVNQNSDPGKQIPLNDVTSVTSTEHVPEVVVEPNHEKSSDAPTSPVSNGSQGSYAAIFGNKGEVLSNPSLVSDKELLGRDKVKLTWEDLEVLAELPKPSFVRSCIARRKGLDLGPTSKQILFNGKILIFYIPGSRFGLFEVCHKFYYG